MIKTCFLQGLVLWHRMRSTGGQMIGVDVPRWRSATSRRTLSGGMMSSAWRKNL